MNPVQDCSQLVSLAVIPNSFFFISAEKGSVSMHAFVIIHHEITPSTTGLTWTLQLFWCFLVCMEIIFKYLLPTQWIIWKWQLKTENRSPLPFSHKTTLHFNAIVSDFETVALSLTSFNSLKTLACRPFSLFDKWLLVLLALLFGNFYIPYLYFSKCVSLKLEVCSNSTNTFSSIDQNSPLVPFSTHDTPQTVTQWTG